MSYSNYGPGDFVQDKKFRQWVQCPNPESNYFWEKWLLKHPEKSEAVGHARQMIEELGFMDYELLEIKRRTLWQNIDQQIGKLEAPKSNGAKIYRIDPIQDQKKTTQNPVAIFVKIAAVLVVVAVLSILIVRSSHLNPNGGNAKVSVIKKGNPKGQKSKIFLPDGSIVYLNAASTISYPSTFGDERIVHLDGEAYFEVKKDVKRPFKVYSGGIVTTALGTSFNILAFGEDANVIVSLVHGKVKVESLAGQGMETLVLTPGLEADYAKSLRKLQKRHFLLAETMAWKDGILIFDNTPLKTVFHRLENWYGVTFKVDGLPNNTTTVVSGKFDNEYLDNVLLSLSYTSRFHYILKDKEVDVSFENKVPM